MDRTKVFVSYSHQDDIWKDRLLRHMALLEFWGLLHVWVDTRIVIGEDWKRKIQEAMEDSQVALLLVSANFLTSKFIQSEELPRLFQLHSERGLQILPIMIRPCAWKLVPWLAQRQVRPLSGWPLSAGAEVQVDLDLAAITYEVAALIKRIDGTTAADQLDLAGSLNSRISWLSDNATHSTASVPAQPRDAAAIDDAYHALEIAAEELRGTSSWAMRDGILRLIEQAIRYGAPIYNAGSRLGCALVYTHTANLILDLLAQHPAVARKEHTPVIDTAQQALRAVVHPMESITHRNADRLAWDLRHAFDRIRGQTV